ncbi:MAG: hypothetical protein Q4G66_03925 [bacterium]|nr:hypothetical protein [bacterium]
MQLDSAIVQLRKRTAWQALDTGVLLARRWYARLLALWLVVGSVLLPLIVATAWLLPGEPLRWALFLFWLLHPMMESALIFWAGRAMFATELGIGASLRLMRGVFSFSFLAGLIRYRLHPLRPFAYAVLTLEEPEAGMIAPRIALLGRRQDNTIFFLLASLAITLLLSFSALVALLTLMPEELYRPSLADLLSPVGRWLLFALYVSTCALMAPFTVSCGFMLYISRRVELEAWDIELGFRNLNARLMADKR